MKTVLKLVVALALLNAVVRGAGAAWDYYKLRDTAQQLLLFGAEQTGAQLHAQILSAAADLDIPLKSEDLSIRRNGPRRVAEGAYTQSIEFFPNYRYPVTFSFLVDAIMTGAPTADDDYTPRR
jgi:hypothetical protein